MIDDQERDATWHIGRGPINREIRAVDLHLSKGGGGVRGNIRLTRCVLISTVDQEDL